MKNDVLNFVKFGIPVPFDSSLYNGDIKPKRNSKNVKKNCSVVHKLLSDLDEAGHIKKVNFKPLVISPLNLVPKSNGSPRLIHNLTLFHMERADSALLQIVFFITFVRDAAELRNLVTLPQI